MSAKQPILTDGAWGTELQARGLGPDELPDFWNVAFPERVEEVARAYVQAGSEVILTNTFRANRVVVVERDPSADVAALNRAGVEISRRAAAGRARVFASMGPSGKLLIAGDVSENDLKAAFAEQADALAEAGADAIVVETMSDLVEARIAVAAAKATGLPVVACMVYDSGRNKDRTMMGVTPEQAADELAAAGASVIGANCGNGIAGYVPVCARLRAASSLPVWIKANAGLPELAQGRVVYRTSPEEFARHIPALVEAGAGYIGGCCGTDPEYIRAARAALARACV
ncbi:MAG: homocysteine S-methyltransferase family protein [Bryobacteraceae bacterium]|nr:homocysteine S-methyltransferase family protein [Bryobacteraceae bacterium]